MKIREAMHRGIDCCEPKTSLSDIARTMRDDDVGAVPVSENGKLIGMVTDRDIVCRAIADGRDTDSLTARDIMSRDIVFCTEEEEVEDALHLMEEKRIRRLPVLGPDQRMVGMLSLGDISHAVDRSLTGELTAAVSAHH